MGRGLPFAASRPDRQVSGSQFGSADVRYGSLSADRQRHCSFRKQRKRTAETAGTRSAWKTISGEATIHEWLLLWVAVHPFHSRQAHCPAGLSTAGIGAASMARQCQLPLYKS